MSTEHFVDTLLHCLLHVFTQLYIRSMQILQDSLRSLCRILHWVVCILYTTVLEMLPTTSRNTSKTSRPSLISSSNIWIACTSRVCASGTSVTITVSLKSLPAWKDMHTYTHINKQLSCFTLYFRSKTNSTKPIAFSAAAYLY